LSFYLINMQCNRVISAWLQGGLLVQFNVLGQLSVNKLITKYYNIIIYSLKFTFFYSTNLIKYKHLTYICLKSTSKCFSLNNNFVLKFELITKSNPVNFPACTSVIRHFWHPISYFCHFSSFKSMLCKGSVGREECGPCSQFPNDYTF
jgi:hypothetical protein